MTEPTLFLDGRVTVHQGDCRVVLKAMASASVHAIVTDPPYGLNFMGKAWDSPDGAAFAVELWREALRVLKPGGHMLAFSGTRTYHRMVVAIEDAGFEIRDQFGWLYGSGFPKSLDVGKAIDKLDAGQERRRRDLKFTAWMRSTGLSSRRINEATNSVMASHYLTDKEQPAVPTRQHMDLLRPLIRTEIPDWVEQLVDERTVESENFKARAVIAESGPSRRPTYTTGNIGGDAEANEYDITAPHTPEAIEWQGWGTAVKPAWEPLVLARKPLSGTVAETVLAHGTGALNIDACRVEGGDEAPAGRSRHGGGLLEGGSFQMPDSRSSMPAGRFPANIVHDGSDEVLAAFPSQAGAFAPVRGSEPSVPAKGDVAYGFRQRVEHVHHGDSGSAARFFYTAKADAEDRIGSKHPTVKPLDLMQYYVRLVTPKGGVVLDPFAGTGTTGEAAWREGFAAVLIERDPDSVADIARRMDLAVNPTKRAAVAKSKNKLQGAEGTPLFGGIE